MVFEMVEKLRRKVKGGGGGLRESNNRTIATCNVYYDRNLAYSYRSVLGYE